MALSGIGLPNTARSLPVINPEEQQLHSPKNKSAMLKNSPASIRDEDIRQSVVQGITHIESSSQNSKPPLPSEEWMEKHKRYLFQFIGYGRIDKLLKVVQLNLKAWGASERLSEIMNARNKDNKTPLELAIDWRSPGHIKVFRKYGAEVTQEILEYGNRKLPAFIFRELT